MEESLKRLLKNSYSPYSGKDVTEKITKRTKTVLSQMKKFNYITR